MDHAISWVSIPSSDFDRAVTFYSAIFDTSIETSGEGDERIAPLMPMDDMDRVNAGVSGDSSFKPTNDGVRVYLNTAGKLDEVLGRVEAAGGKIITPKTAIGEHGYYGLIEDSEGNHVGLHSM